MLSKFVSALKTTASTRWYASASRAAGSLYTWGEQRSSLGYSANDDAHARTPKRVDGVENVVKVVFGSNHTVVLTADGQVFTFGAGSTGALGHYNTTDQVTPRAVEFFNEKRIRVKDIAAGCGHSLALSEDGHVYSWGHNGAGLFSGILGPVASALGYQAAGNVTAPQTIEGLQQISAIATGRHHGLALTKDHELLVWGKGAHAVFGDGSHRDLVSPTINEFVHKLKQKKHINLEHLKTVDRSNFALASNGLLLSWGCNENGQLGNKDNVGVEFDQEVETPKPLIDLDFHGQKIIDFDVSDNLSIFLTDQGRVLWSGFSLAFRPFAIDLPRNVTPVKVAATSGALAILGNDNKIYTKYDFVDVSSQDFENGLGVADASLFGNSQILTIGGGYRNRFAIVKS